MWRWLGPCWQELLQECQNAYVNMGHQAWKQQPAGSKAWHWAGESLLIAM